MFAKRALQFPKYLPSRIFRKHFSSTPAAMVKVGDSIPSVELFEDSPGNKVNIANELSSGKGVIIGVPAAFSPGCSDTHIPGYMGSSKLKESGKVFVISVNDAFVMKAWQKNLNAKEAGIRFLGDADGSFTKAMDTGFDATKILGNTRSKRYAALTEDGKITNIFIEPDNTGITGSAADKILDATKL